MIGRLDVSIPVSNALCDIAGTLKDRGHPVAGKRVLRVRRTVDQAWCRVFGHPRIVYGATCDICLDCLSIVDEHTNGRGRSSESEG